MFPFIIILPIILALLTTFGIGASFVFGILVIGAIILKTTSTGKSTTSLSSHSITKQFHSSFIRDKYNSLEDVQRALRQAGLESSNMICAVDFTKSNSWNGEKTFNGKCLHSIDPKFSELYRLYRENSSRRIIEKAKYKRLKKIDKPPKSFTSTSINSNNESNENEDLLPPSYDETMATSLSVNTPLPSDVEDEKELANLYKFMNPYQRVICTIGRTLAAFDDDQLIPLFGFGDSMSVDRAVLEIGPNSHHVISVGENVSKLCHGFYEMLEAYGNAVPKLVLSGPTSFAPVIRQASAIAKEAGGYHILVIICDGQVTNEKETVDAIVEASATAPLSIIAVGVGDGPWEVMENFDDGLPHREFDNFQFVNENKVREGGDVAFAVAALQEIPDQFRAIKALRRL